MEFNIKDHVEFDAKNRAICPSCALTKEPGYRKQNLSVLDSGAYKCFAGCTPQDIRDALGTPKERQIPQALAHPTIPAVAPKPVTVTPQKVKEAHSLLVNSDGPAKKWLHDRGITDGMITHYRLGIVKARQGNRNLPAIAIPLVASEHETDYYMKKRVAPWMAPEELPAEYKPWSQYGIPNHVWFTHLPDNATETWLCEGEWDAMMLAWKMCDQTTIAVACFTCGCDSVPPPEQLELLPGTVTIFYDIDEPGRNGALKAANKIGQRARIATVPYAEPPEEKWDVSDALNSGVTIAEFEAAAMAAIASTTTSTSASSNPLRQRLVSNDDLLARAPDYIEWLVPDLLTTNELFLLAAAPRAGKSLLAMELARCIASGQKFLDRPVTQGPVVFVRCEDSETKTKERETAQGWEPGLPVYWLDKFKLQDLPHLREIAVDLEARLIILDTLSRVRDGAISESSAEMSQVLEPLQEMAQELGICVLLIHHTGKVKLDDVNGFVEVFDSIRGSSAIRAVCRGTIIIAPDDRSGYRLCVENGHTKENLLVELDLNTLRWKLKGRWNPTTVNMDQKQQALDFLTKVGEADIDRISAETCIPKRSLYQVLTRLCADGLIIKVGTRRQSVYRKESIQQIQLLNSLLNSPNPYPDDDAGVIQQKNTFSSSATSLPVTSSSDDGEEAFRGEEAFLGGHTFVELASSQPSNADTANVSAIQQQFNRNSTVEFKRGDRVEILRESGKWVNATYWSIDGRSMVAHSAAGLHESHWVDYRKSRIRVAQPDLRLPGGGDNADG